MLGLFARPSSRHRYGGEHRVQRADLHLPPGAGPHPVAVVLHGGYWRARYGKVTTRPISADLARHGWAVWNVEYRRMGRGQGGGYPATLDDVAAAIDQLAGLDAPLDLDRVTAVGHSAGGQLALWAAARRDGRVRIARVVALAPLTAMADTARSDPESAVPEFLGGGPDDVPDRYAATDPIARLPLGLPMLLVHGDADPTVPLRRSRQYAEAARAAGDDVELVEVPGADHRDVIDPPSAAWRAAREWVTNGTFAT